MTEREAAPQNKQRGGFEPDDTPRPCISPEHNPPSHMYVPPGVRYRHICPACGFECVLRSAEVFIGGTTQ